MGHLRTCCAVAIVLMLSMTTSQIAGGVDAVKLPPVDPASMDVDAIQDTLQTLFGGLLGGSVSVNGNTINLRGKGDEPAPPPVPTNTTASPTYKYGRVNSTLSPAALNATLFDLARKGGRVAKKLGYPFMPDIKFKHTVAPMGTVSPGPGQLPPAVLALLQEAYAGFEESEDGGGGDDNPLEFLMKIFDVLQMIMPTKDTIHGLLDLPTCLIELIVDAVRELGSGGVCKIGPLEVSDETLDMIQLDLNIEFLSSLGIPFMSLREMCDKLMVLRAAIDGLTDIAVGKRCHLSPVSGLIQNDQTLSAAADGLSSVTKTKEQREGIALLQEEERFFDGMGGMGGSGEYDAAPAESQPEPAGASVGSGAESPNASAAPKQGSRGAGAGGAMPDDMGANMQDAGEMIQQGIAMLKEVMGLAELFFGTIVENVDTCAETPRAEFSFRVDIEQIGHVEVIGSQSLCCVLKALTAIIPAAIDLIINSPIFQIFGMLKDLIKVLVDTIIKPILSIPDLLMGLLPQTPTCVLQGVPLDEEAMRAISLRFDIGLDLKIASIQVPKLYFKTQTGNDLCFIVQVLDGLVDKLEGLVQNVVGQVVEVDGLSLEGLGLGMVKDIINIPIKFIVDVVRSFEKGSHECAALFSGSSNPDINLLIDLPPFIYIPSGIYVADNPSLRLGPIVRIWLDDARGACSLVLGLKNAIEILLREGITIGSATLKGGMEAGVDAAKGKGDGTPVAVEDDAETSSESAGDSENQALVEATTPYDKHKITTPQLLARARKTAKLLQSRLALIEVSETQGDDTAEDQGADGGATGEKKSGGALGGTVDGVANQAVGMVSKIVKMITDMIDEVLKMLVKILPDLDTFKSILQLPICLLTKVIETAKSVISDGPCKPAMGEDAEEIPNETLDKVKLTGEIALPSATTFAIPSLRQLCRVVTIVQRAASEVFALVKQDEGNALDRLEECFHSLQDEATKALDAAGGVVESVTNAGDDGDTEAETVTNAGGDGDTEAEPAVKSGGDATASDGEAASHDDEQVPDNTPTDGDKEKGMMMDEVQLIEQGLDDILHMEEARKEKKIPKRRRVVTTEMKEKASDLSKGLLVSMIEIQEHAGIIDKITGGKDGGADITNMIEMLVKNVASVIENLVNVPLKLISKLFVTIKNSVESCEEFHHIDMDAFLTVDPILYDLTTHDTVSMCVLVKGVSRVIQNSEEEGGKLLTSLPMLKDVPMLDTIFSLLGIVSKLAIIPEKLLDIFPKETEGESREMCKLGDVTYHQLDDLQLKVLIQLNLKLASYQLPKFGIRTHTVLDLCRIIMGLEKFMDGSENPIETILKIAEDAVKALMEAVPGVGKVAGKILDSPVGDIAGGAMGGDSPMGDMGGGGGPMGSIFMQEKTSTLGDDDDKKDDDTEEDDKKDDDKKDDDKKDDDKKDDDKEKVPKVTEDDGNTSGKGKGSKDPTKILKGLFDNDPMEAMEAIGGIVELLQELLASGVDIDIVKMILKMVTGILQLVLAALERSTGECKELLKSGDGIINPDFPLGIAIPGESGFTTPAIPIDFKKIQAALGVVVQLVGYVAGIVTSVTGVGAVAGGGSGAAGSGTSASSAINVSFTIPSIHIGKLIQVEGQDLLTLCSAAQAIRNTVEEYALEPVKEEVLGEEAVHREAPANANAGAPQSSSEAPAESQAEAPADSQPESPFESPFLNEGKKPEMLQRVDADGPTGSKPPSRENAKALLLEALDGVEGLLRSNKHKN